MKDIEIRVVKCNCIVKYYVYKNNNILLVADSYIAALEAIVKRYIGCKLIICNLTGGENSATKTV